MADWTEITPYPITEPDQLVTFLDQVGICLWWTMPGVPLPSLAARMELAHPDDLWGTWFWKDDLHIARKLFSCRLVANRPTFVSLAMLPYVIAAHGVPDDLRLGRDRGQAIVRVYDNLLRYRVLSISHLRRRTRMTGPQEQKEVDAALESLAASFHICKVGITGRTRGTYGYVWGLLEDWLPDALESAMVMEPGMAARHIVNHLARFGVRMPQGEWERLFGWSAEVAAEAVQE